MNKLGWVGAILLSFCAVPEVIRSLRTETCSLSWGLLMMWGLGELLTLISVIYLVPTGWLILNYSVNLVCITILVRFKLK